MVKNFRKNDEGVSAVIGVILMVAITVILAAVIAAFVFSMSNSVSKPYTVGITIKKTASGDVLVTNSGGPDVGQLDHVYITFQPSGATAAISAYTGAAPAVDTTTNLYADIDDFDNLKTVGGSFTIPSEGVPTNWADLTAGYVADTEPATPTHVIVTGYFKDGKTQVIGEADV